MDASHCGNCSSPTYHQLHYSRDYASREPPETAHCSQQGLVRSIPDNTIFDPRRYYDSAYYGQEGRLFPFLMERLVRAFRHSRAIFIKHLRPQPGKILAIGRGRGWILAELQGCSWECVGTEAAQELAEAAERGNGIGVRLATDTHDQFSSSSFDVITLWHTLEYTPDPFDTLKEVHGLLKSGGHIIVETPNYASLQSRLRRGRWFHLDVPRHLCKFSSANLHSILQDQGIRVIKRRTLSLEYGFYGFSHTSLNFIVRQPYFSYMRPKWNHGSGRRWYSVSQKMDFLLTIFAAPLAIFFGVMLEIAAAIIGMGGVIQFTAIRHDKI